MSTTEKEELLLIESCYHNEAPDMIVLGIVIVVVVALSACFMGQKPKESASPLPSETATAAPVDNSFSESEKNDLLERILDTENRIEIFDSAFGDKDSAIYVAAACKDLNTGLESGLAYVTELGVGYLLLASDVSDLVYLPEEGIALSASNIVTLSFLKTSTNEIHDFEIESTKSYKKVNFVINENIRKNDTSTN